MDRNVGGIIGESESARAGNCSAMGQKGGIVDELGERDFYNILEGRSRKGLSRKILWHMGIGGALMIGGLALTAYFVHILAVVVLGWVIFALGIGIMSLGYRIQVKGYTRIKVDAKALYEANKGIAIRNLNVRGK